MNHESWSHDFWCHGPLDAKILVPWVKIVTHGVQMSISIDFHRFLIDFWWCLGLQKQCYRVRAVTKSTFSASGYFDAKMVDFVLPSQTRENQPVSVEGLAREGILIFWYHES